MKCGGMLGKYNNQTHLNIASIIATVMTPYFEEKNNGFP